jgi:DNA-binding NarL/FixJ family response regulator
MRVLIADDHPLFRAGLRALIDEQEDMRCVAEASSAAEALDKAGTCRPEVAVLDLRMPGPTGISAVRRIVADAPSVGVLVLTMLDDEASVTSAMRAGARGYVLKDAPVDQVVSAIRAVGHGEATFGPAVANRILAPFAAAPSAAARAFPDLTERERTILERIADGASNGQIAYQLDLSAKTVRNHVSNICNKLQVLDRVQAALRARERGLGQTAAGEHDARPRRS